MTLLTEPARLAQLARDASEEAVALAVMVLEGDLANRAWADQVGPSLSQRDTARLLGRTEQSVSKDKRLLRVHRHDGRPVYPIVQFDGRHQVAGIADVVATLDGAVGELTVASWLTASNDALAGRRPIDVLAEGDIAAVMAAAVRFASRMHH